MSEDVSIFRLYLMRTVYLLNAVGVGSSAWPGIITHDKAWDPLHGVAYSFWAALSALMALGVRYPLQMLPMVLLQLFYKSVWLVAVALPLWSAGRPSGLVRIFVMGVVADLIVIPWPYVLTHYLRKSADRWR